MRRVTDLAFMNRSSTDPVYGAPSKPKQEHKHVSTDPVRARSLSSALAFLFGLSLQSRFMKCGGRSSISIVIATVTIAIPMTLGLAVVRA